jgi:hypothetical protein
MTKTTILGVEYDGIPRMGSAAFDIWQHEDRFGLEAAERLLKAKNSIRKAWGIKPHNLADDMTTESHYGGFTFGVHRDQKGE